jgi:Fusaric acid resistance protein-like
MSAARDLVNEAFRTQEHGVAWRAGLAGGIASAGPLAVGLAADEATLGLTAAIGGLNAALGVPAAGLRSRVWWGSLALVGEIGSLAVADLVGDADWAIVAVTLVWVGAWALTRAAGRAGAIVGFATAAVFVVLAGLPPSPEPFGERLLWFSAAGLLGFVLMVAAREGPEAPGDVVRDSLRAIREAVVGANPAVRQHAARLAISVAAATLLALALDLQHGYWVPLTTLAILQPGEHATRVRSLQRALGTVAGAALIVAITLITHEAWVLVAAAAASGIGLFALDERGYFWLVVMITPTVLLMLSSVDFQGDDVGLERMANSALGILIGIALGEVAWRLWPTRAAPAPSRAG